jgi:hypothetical protein
MSKYDCWNLVIQAAILATLAVSAIFIIKYWRETQKMKNEMVKQNDIATKNMMLAHMPIPAVELEQGGEKFTFDAFIINKGAGPAFKVTALTLPLDKLTHKAAATGKTGKLQPQQRGFEIIGKEERVQFFREFSDSYRLFQVRIIFSDIFHQSYMWTYEGDRDGVKLKEYSVETKT